MCDKDSETRDLMLDILPLMYKTNDVSVNILQKWLKYAEHENIGSDERRFDCPIVWFGQDGRRTAVESKNYGK